MGDNGSGGRARHWLLRPRGNATAVGPGGRDNGSQGRGDTPKSSNCYAAPRQESFKPELNVMGFPLPSEISFNTGLACKRQRDEFVPGMRRP